MEIEMEMGMRISMEMEMAGVCHVSFLINPPSSGTP